MEKQSVVGDLYIGEDGKPPKWESSSVDTILNRIKNAIQMAAQASLHPKEKNKLCHHSTLLFSRQLEKDTESSSYKLIPPPPPAPKLKPLMNCDDVICLTG